MKGYKVVYEPGAIASELPSASIKEEWKRKVRICAGGFQSLQYLPGVWNPFRYGWLSIQFLSHRFLRWSVIPFLIPVMLILLGVLAFSSSFYLILFSLSTAALIVASLALALADKISIPKILLVPGYILMLNAAAYFGLFRYWKGSQSVAWEKAKRQSNHSPT
jgi:cellulose synthase/poly-beta-1,6-N-acetylglucosamine synthase-like glycosyltransferase